MNCLQKNEAIKVLHICEAFDPGGVVWWLIGILKRMPRDRLQSDFYSLGKTPGMRAQEVFEWGSNITLFRATYREIIFGSQLRAVLRSGHYDIVHAHIFNLSGWMLRHACAENVPVRIIHYHSVSDGRADSLCTRARRWISRRVAARYANAILGASQAALDNGPELRHGTLSQVLHYGIDVNRFSSPAKGVDLRAELKLPACTQMVVHVGRFVPAKNHHGLIEIFARVVDRKPNVHLVLVGDGPLMAQIRSEVDGAGLSNRVWFLGARPGVAEILGQMNVFAFPSWYEGMAIALLEARVAGLPVVASSLDPFAEAMRGCDGYRLIDPGDHMQFADAIVACLESGKRVYPPRQWVDQFDEQKSANRLIDIYRALVAR